MNDFKIWQIFPSYSEHKPGSKDVVINPGSLQCKNSSGNHSFLLGSSINQAMEVIKNLGTQDKIDLKFNAENPMSMPIIIDIVSLGIELYFNSSSQMLQLIRVYKNIIGIVHNQKHDQSPLKWFQSLNFSHNFDLFSKETTYEQFKSVSGQMFGTYAQGSYSKDKKYYIQPIHGRIMGITLVFTLQEAPKEGDLGPPPKQLGAQLSDMYMFVPDETNAISEMKFNEQFSFIVPPEKDRIEVTAPKDFDGPWYDYFAIKIEEATTQDVIALLGNPQHITYKTQQQMQSFPFRNDYSKDYFYNYFKLGVDILFDGTRHLVKKIVLHTNLPTEANFYLYHKCNFLMESENAKHLSPDAKWNSEEFKEIFPRNEKEAPCVKPVSDADNPFGTQTLFHFSQNVIFEVASNDHIASVTLLPPPLWEPEEDGNQVDNN